MNNKIPSQPLSRQVQEQWQQPLGSISLCFARSTNPWKFQKGRSQRQKSTCRNHSPYNLSCPSFPFKFDDLAVLELFREESRLTLPAPAVQSSAQSVPYSWLYYNNNAATVHLHLLQRSLTIPQRDAALKKERPRHNKRRSLGSTVPQKVRGCQPGHLTVSTVREKERKQGQEGRKIREKKKSKNVPGKHVCSCEEKIKRGKNVWNNDSRTFKVKSQWRHDSTCLAALTF